MRKRAPTHQQKLILASQLSQAMYRAGELGLYRTVHAVHEAVRVVGWEIAEEMERQQKTHRGSS